VVSSSFRVPSRVERSTQH